MAARILLLLFTVAFAAQLGLGLISPLLPIYAQDLGASGLMLGFIFAVFSLARFVAMPIVGRYSDAHGRKRFIIYGLAAYSIISLGYIFTDTAELLTVIRFAHGISSSLILPVAMAYAGDIAPKGREGRYLGLFQSGMFLGIGSGPLLGGAVADSFGMASAFATMGMLAFVNLVFVITILPESTAQRRTGPKVPYLKVLSDRPVQAVLAYRVVNALGQGMVMSFLPIYAFGELGIPLALVGLILSSRMLTLSGLQGPCGLLADRFNRNLLVLIGAVVFAIALLALPMATNVEQLIAVNIIGAVGSAVSNVAITAIITTRGRVFGMGTLMGVYNSMASLGRSIGPILGGLMFDAYGISELFYVGGILSIAGVVTFTVLIRRNEM